MRLSILGNRPVFHYKGLVGDTFTLSEMINVHIFSSCKLHPLLRGRVSLVPRLISSVHEKEPGYEAKEGSGHTATMESSPRQELDVANQIALVIGRIHCHGVQLHQV